MTRFGRSLMLVVASLGVVAPAVHAQQPEWTVLILSLIHISEPTRPY